GYIGFMLKFFHKLRAEGRLVVICLHPSEAYHLDILREICERFVFVHDGGLTHAASLDALSRNTTVRIAAVDSGFQTGPAAQLDLPHVPGPGPVTNITQSSGGVLLWQDGTPPQTRGWLVEYWNGSVTVQEPQFARATAGFRDPIIISGLDAFGPGTSTSLSFALPPPS
ncbi:MAG: hypothetical protein RQ750_18940, partial [Roseovarius sp.]|nr:hypothetical protein [Roseovarius sp.]